MAESESDFTFLVNNSDPDKSYELGMELGDRNESMTLEEYLNTVLGPKRLEGPLLIPVTVFYVAVFLTGLMGNFSVCIVICRNRSLHSAMNFYLISLAIADLSILLLGLPNELSIYWHQYPFPFGETFCKFRSFISETSSYASVLTIMAFSLERYIAICRPLKALPWTDGTRVLAISFFCWCIAMIFSLPHLLFTQLNYLDYPFGSGNIVEESAFCALLDNNIYPEWYPVHEVSFLVFFLVPCLLLTYLYSCMAMAIKKSARSDLRRSVHRQSAGPPTDHRQQIIRMLIAVVVLFFISWAPFHIQRLGYVYFKDSPSFRTVNENLFYISGCLYFLSSTLNPLLYNLMSAKYREAFKSTFCGRKCESDQNSRKIPAWVTQTTMITSNGSRRFSEGPIDPLGSSTKLPMSQRKLLAQSSTVESDDRNGDRFMPGGYWQPDQTTHRLGPLSEEKEDYC